MDSGNDSELAAGVSSRAGLELCKTELVAVRRTLPCRLGALAQADASSLCFAQESLKRLPLVRIPTRGEMVGCSGGEASMVESKFRRGTLLRQFEMGNRVDACLPACGSVMPWTTFRARRPWVCPGCYRTYQISRSQAKALAACATVLACGVSYAVGARGLAFLIATAALWFPALLICIPIAARISPPRLEPFRVRQGPDSHTLAESHYTGLGISENRAETTEARGESPDKLGT